MQATLTTATSAHHTSVEGAGFAHSTKANFSNNPEADMSVNSDLLLRGNKSVAIVHNGAIYRLQATKLGKLILTK